MKKQILRLSLGMAWCLSALAPVHAPAAGASATADHAARRDTRTAAAQTRPSPADTLHVVFFTDIHVTPGNAQDSLFRVAVAEANASDAELVIFGGDLTNTGSDEELEHVYGLMSQLEKPWFTVMGNHETTWSESGCTTFRCIFGHDGRVAYRAGGYLFLGYNCGPYMKMADGVVRTEDLAWLGAQAAGVLFNIVCAVIDLLQIAQEERGRTIEDLKEEARLLKGIEKRVFIFRKRPHDFCFLNAERNDKIGRNKNAKRQCVVAVRFHDNRNINNDKNVFVFQFHVGTFFRIQ